MTSFFNVVLLGLLSAGAARAEVPALVASGFEAYKAAGSKEALAIWLKGAPPSAGTAIEGLPPDVGPGFEKPGAFGPMESYEILATFSPSTRLRRVYAVAYFPQGPLFCCFDLYRTSNGWTTYGLKLNLVPDQVLPVDLLEKSS